MTSATRTIVQNVYSRDSSVRETLQARVRTTPEDYRDSFHTLLADDGNWKVWGIKGNAEHIWKNRLESGVKDLANFHALPLRRRHGSANVSIHCWMVGRDEDRAGPRVVIVCYLDGYRKNLKRIIRRNGILDTSLLHDVLVTGSPEQFRFDVMSLPYPIQEGARHFWASSVYAQDRNPRMGMPVHVLTKNSGTAPAFGMKATIGGLVQLGGQYFGLTVAHIFDKEDSTPNRRNSSFANAAEEDRPEENIGSKINLLNFDTDDTNSDESEDEEDIPEDKQEVENEETSDEETIPGKSDIMPAREIVHHQPRDFPTLFGEISKHTVMNRDLDWALIPLDFSVPSTYTNSVEDDLLHPTNLTENQIPITVVAKDLRQTVSIVISGYTGLSESIGLKSTCLYQSHKSTTFVRRWVASFNPTLQLGDCGSWVVEPANRSWHGVVVAFGPLNLTYISPAFDIRSKIELMTNMEVKLPGERLRSPTLTSLRRHEEEIVELALDKAADVKSEDGADTSFKQSGFRSSPQQINSSPQSNAATTAPKAKPKPIPGSKRGMPNASFRNISVCNRCRIRKNRCDQRLPACEACEKVGAKCVGWDPFLGRAVPRSYVYFLESRSSYLEGLLEKNGIAFSPAEELASGSGRVLKREHRDGGQSPAASGNEVPTPMPSQANVGSPKLKQEQSDERNIDNLVSNVGMVSVQGALDPRYLSSTSGISFARVVLHAMKTTVSKPGSEQLSNSENKSRQIFTVAGPSTMRDSIFGLHTKPNIKEAPFPDKELGLKLVDLYFEHANPQIPTLHRGEFMSLFERVYEPNHNRTSKESYLLNIVFAIGAGTIFSRAEKDVKPENQSNSTQQSTQEPNKRVKLSGVQYQPEEYHASAIIHLERFLGSSSADSYGGGLEELQAVLLLAGFALLRPVAPGLWYIVGVATRLAVDLRLHYEDGHDPSETYTDAQLGRGEDIHLAGSGPDELHKAEIGRREWVRDLRRRLWWCTYSFDRLVGTIVGRPFSISDQVVTTSFPSLKDDTLITTTGFVESPNRSQPSYKLVAQHYIRLRLLQSEIVQVLQYQSAQKAFRNKRPAEIDPYIYSNLSSPFLQHFMSFGSWRKDMDRRLRLWGESAPLKEQIGVAFNPQFLELNYWQAVILLYRQSVVTPAMLAGEESKVKDGIASPHAIDIVPEEDEDEEFIYVKIAEAGKKALEIYRRLHRMNLVNYAYLATHHLFIAGISFLYAIWYSRVVRTYLTLDEVDSTILGALSVLEDLTAVCPPARSCKDAFDRMSRMVLQVAQDTTGFGPQTAAFAGHPVGHYGLPPAASSGSSWNSGSLSALESNNGAQDISDFYEWNTPDIDGTHDWSDGNSIDIFRDYFFFGPGNGPADAEESSGEII